MGGGGGVLAGELLGHQPVCGVEINPYCRSIIKQRQDDGILPVFPIWNDIKTFDGRPWRGCVDIVSGGFPCQDISSAGNGAGIDGAKSGLWSEMYRVVCEVRPGLVFVENSPNLAFRGLDRVLLDLHIRGYDAEWDCFGACDVGAPHHRHRVWILAKARHSADAHCHSEHVCTIDGQVANPCPTPCGADADRVRNNGSAKDEVRSRRNGAKRRGGWLMGWPTAWTETAPLATAKYQQWLRSHSAS